MADISFQLLEAKDTDIHHATDFGKGGMSSIKCAISANPLLPAVGSSVMYLAMCCYLVNVIKCPAVKELVAT